VANASPGFQQSCASSIISIAKLPFPIMKIDPKLHHRQSIRMKGYDYSLPGAYFVTLVTRDRLHLFGEITNGIMHHNHLAGIVRAVWRHLPASFPVQLDECVIMPNHLNGIIWILDSNKGEASTNPDSDIFIEPWVDASPLPLIRGTQQGTLGAIIQNFKSISTRKIHPFLSRGEEFACNQSEASSTRMANASPRSIWQRDYFDRIIRDEKELDLIRLYIHENPSQWAEDPENRNHQ
jgi:REP element-mobilizing transposase RayT